LRGACALVCARSSTGRHYVAGVEHAATGSHRQPGGIARSAARSEWDLEVGEEIASARADGYRVDPLLRRIHSLPTARWPTATHLARASLRWKPSHAGRLDLARAHLAEEDPGGAIEILRRLLDEHPLPAVRTAALETLAMALEWGGEARASLACYEAAVLEPRSDARVAVGLLALALRLGDPTGIRLAEERLGRLDLRIAGTRRRFDRALRAATVRSGRAPSIGTSADVRGSILRLVRSGAPACSEVARKLL
jgi:hypothetical protein